MGQRIEIKTLEGRESFSGYLVAPRKLSSAGIVVLQGSFGVNARVRANADYWANMGFQALAPDLFWRFEPGLELNENDEADQSKARVLRSQFDMDLGIRDVEAAIKKMLGKGCRRVGVIGYYFGGLLAYLAAARTDSAANVSFYGAGMRNIYLGPKTSRRPLPILINSRFGRQHIKFV